MKKIWMSVLMNMSGDSGEEYRLLSIRKDIVTDSAEKGGTEEMKAMLRMRIVEELFNNDVKSFFEGMGLTDEMIDNCINELAMGKDSNILGENFWWEEEDVIVSLTDEEPKPKVWVMTQESNVDGCVSFNVVVCNSKESAIKVMQIEKEWIKNESIHFRNYDENDGSLSIEDGKDGFFILDECNSYYENLTIEEKEIVNK